MKDNSMDKLIRRMLDLQFELTTMGAEMDEKANRLECLPGIHEMIQSESRHLILMAANIKYDIKVLRLAFNKENASGESFLKENKEALNAINDIEHLYSDTFRRFFLLLEKLENNPRNKEVEELVREVWQNTGETYSEFRQIISGLEYYLSGQQNRHYPQA